ncbi:MAG: TRAP transporter small permease [SAR324 cluster bacterium]|nr:TRAP transporter small permease [SAR324 cluster bacterium]
MTAAAGTAMVLMMLIVVFDIVGRSFNFWHILSSIEQIRLYMMLLGFFGLALCFQSEGNIVVDVATHKLPEWIVRRIDAFWSLVTAVILLPLSFFVFKSGIVLHDYGQRSEVLGISPLVHHTIASVGMAIAGMVSIIVFLRLLKSKEGDDTGDEKLE